LKQSKIWLYLALLLPSAAVLFLHAYNGAYTRFISDDYCSAWFSEQLGILRFIWYWYITWGGRYSAIASDTVLVWTRTGGVGVITPLALLVWGFAIAGVIFGIQPASRDFKLKLRDSVCFGAVLLFVMLLLTPTIPQSLYWWNGFRTHTLPLIVFTIYLAIYQWFRVQEPNKRTMLTAIIFGFLLSLVNDGFSETFTLTQIVFLAAWIVWLLLSKKLDARHPGFAYLAAGLAGALVSMVIILLAPGNEQRQSFYKPSLDILAILQISFSGYFSLLKYFFIPPERIVGLAGAFVGFVWFGKQFQPEQTPKNWEPSAILATGFLLAFACFPPVAFGTGDLPPDRTQIIPVFFLILSIISAAFLLGNRWAGLSSSSETQQKSYWLLIIAVVLIAIAAGFNGKSVLDENAVYVKYAHIWDQNERKIFDAVKSGQKTVIIYSSGNWAGLNEPGDNPKFYVNYCMSKYYNINILGDEAEIQPAAP